MKIDRLELHHVELPLKAPFVTAYGRHDVQRTVLVHAFANGIDAWAETSPLEAPMYCPETTHTVLYMIEEFLAPKVLGVAIASADELLDRLRPVRGNPFAKAGVEIAWWCLRAVAEGRPLHELLGGTSRPIPGAGAVGKTDTIDALKAQVATSLEAGYQRIKLKIMHGWDIEVVRAVREAFGDIRLQVDANACYTLADADHLKQLDAFDLVMIEQPLGYTDLVDHAELQRRLTTPICLDESIHSPDDMRHAIQLGSARIINIKPARVGGLANAVRIHDLCRDAGIPCWVGGMIESSIGGRIGVELATLDNFTIPNGIAPSDWLFAADVMDPPLLLSADGTFTPSTTAPYDGTVNAERVDRFTIEKRVVA